MHLRHGLITRCLVAVGLLSLIVVRPHPATAQDERLALAFYYAWYDTGQWTADKVPDLPVIPYNSRDRVTIERHVDQGRAAGIDAFVVSWYGPQVENNQTETNFRILLDVAQTKGLRATVDVDLGASPFMRSSGDVTAALRHVFTVHAQHPAFLRYGGKPLIFFWRQQRFSVDTWQAIRAEVDPGHDSLWIAEGVDFEYLAVFDGLHLYNVTWDPPADVGYTLSRWGGRVREYNAAHGTDKLWVATAMPGYDDTKAPGRAHTYRHDRRNGEYYRETWQAAIASSPDVVIITSFNEWVEGTMIEPSVSYGNLYLDITAQEVARYK
ncbi:MAG: glycoside hydrolase family 99-like domain-containing protein, partial [Chloroflexota bacterium]|nr:glycoside hydrolase family 99-like domain-containing protein [Chloroflexota bacterium]